MGREGGLEGVGWGGREGRKEWGGEGGEGGREMGEEGGREGLGIYNLVLAYKAITIPTNAKC